MMQSINLPIQTLEWLLEDNNPPVRNLTKKFLLNEEPTEGEIQQVDKYYPIKTILSSLNSKGYWTDPKKPYKKYTGTYWQLIFLADLNANNTNRKLQKVIETIFSYQLPSGGFPHELGFKKAIHCLTANLIRSFIHFGYEEDLHVKNGINFITEHLLENNGVTCIDLATNLLPDCQMSLTKILAMYALIKEKEHNLQIQKAIKIVENKIIENKILFYIPSGVKEYQRAIKGKKIAEIRHIKTEMSKHPDKMKKDEIKRSWMRFGFPNSYISDALETLYWMAMISIPKHSEFDYAIDYLINKMNSSGYWVNEISFRNPMLVEIEPKNSPSKWLTFRASYVLKKYRNMKFQS